MSLSGIWTAKGIDKLAAQTAGGAAIAIDKLALGDGGGMVPVVLPSQTGLLKEVWRGLVNAVLVEPDTPNAVTVEVVIPYNVGGFYIREWGLYDTDGDLMAVGPHAEFYKPLLAEGSGAELLERIQLPLANAGQVSLTISSEALATRKYVEQTATAKAREAVSAHDDDATAHGGKIAALQKRKISVSLPLTGGGDLSADRGIGINAASAPTANFVIQRDAAGRAQVAAPVAMADIARKQETDAAMSAASAAQTTANAAATKTTTLTATEPLTGGGNLTANRTLGINAASAATANFVIQRDAAGRAKVAAPAAADDIARKAEVDAVAARTLTVTAPLTGGGNLTANRPLGINASSAATANFVIQRDAAGRAQVAAPVAMADIARKQETDAAMNVASAAQTTANAANGKAVTAQTTADGRMKTDFSNVDGRSILFKAQNSPWNGRLNLYDVGASPNMHLALDNLVGNYGGIAVGFFNERWACAPFNNLGIQNMSLGTPQQPWPEEFFSSSPVIVSDAREKTAIATIPDAVLRAWARVSFVQYQMRDAVAVKGTQAARLHTGLIAQRVKDAFEAEGLDGFRYGVLCWDQWPAQPEVTEKYTVEISPAEHDAHGVLIKEAVTEEQTRVISPARDAGERFALRYEEALCLEAAYQRWRADKAEAVAKNHGERIAALEAAHKS